MSSAPRSGSSVPLSAASRIRKERVGWVLLVLTLLIAAIYLPAGGLKFVDYDDPDYVTNNPYVADGLTWKGAVWALTAIHAFNWHPVTWLSHMLDGQIYGLTPTGHHWTNVLLHWVNTLGLFLLLERWTRALWRSALVAALFAVHPLHVESVAWVAERKDVLSGLFCLATLWAYGEYVKQSNVQRPQSKVQGPKSKVQTPTSTVENNQLAERLGPTNSKAGAFYFVTLAFFVLGLMSKPMLVTVPFVLLLVDVWPLGRLKLAAPGWFQWSTTELRPKFREKVPFFVLSLGASLATWLAQSRGGSTVGLQTLPMPARLANSLVSYARYLGKLAWPSDLSVIYPYEVQIPAAQALAAGLVLGLVTFWAIWNLKRRSFLLMGWCWFIGMLVPVIGIIQVGNQALADRYTYLPSIGLFIMVSWGWAEVGWGWLRSVPVVATVGTAALFGLVLVAQKQLLYWQDSETLFTRALAVTSNNFVAYNHLGFHFASLGEFEAAKRAYRSSLAISASYAPSWHNLGLACSLQKRYAEAIPNFERALELNPTLAPTRQQLAAAHCFLAQTVNTADRSAEAIDHYEAALRAQPNFVGALNNLAWLLATDPSPQFRDGTRAVELAERACSLTGYRQPLLMGTLGAAYAECGRFDQAAATADKARELAEQTRLVEVAAKNLALRDLYRSGKPYRANP